MAIKKNAAKADIAPKKQVKATLAECKAKDPMKCKYHGPKLLQTALDKEFGEGVAKVKKTKYGYEIAADDAPSVYEKVATLLPNAKGSLGFHKAFFVLDGGGFVSPENEAELEDADTLSAKDAPEKGDAGEKDKVANVESGVDEEDDGLALLEEMKELVSEDDGILEAMKEELLSEVGMDDFVFGGEEQKGSFSLDDVNKYITDSTGRSLPDDAKIIKEILDSGTVLGKPLSNALAEEWKSAYGNGTGSVKDALNKKLDEIIKANNAKPSAPPTKVSLIADMQEQIGKIQDSGMDLTWDAKKGNALGKAFEDAINGNDIEGAAKALKDFKDYIHYLEEGGAASETIEDAVSFTDEELKKALERLYKAEGYDYKVADKDVAKWKTAVVDGTKDGNPLSVKDQKNIQKLKDFVGEDSPISKVISDTLDNLSAKKKTKTAKKASAKEVLVSELGSTESMASDEVLKPLEHDESKFPQGISQKELDKAISKGKKLGGHGGLGTRLVEIGGNKYVCKAAEGDGASLIRNGYNADMAYRAGGVYAPDAQLYDFGDGKAYKLSEFIPGMMLIDVWKDADEGTRDGIRKELLKGYPLDVLFSNYDVLGTSPEDSQTVTITGADGKPQKTHVALNNIMVGDDGHLYRVDNDGAFAMTGTGGIKSSSGGGYTTKVEAEKWGNWKDRQWIDDFRTMRRNEKNLGVFDRYTTADIFLSAANIDIGNVVSVLPEGIKTALAKPAEEMTEMADYAKGTRLAGYPPNTVYRWKGSDGEEMAIKIDPVSIALDAIYEANKLGARMYLQKKISWTNTGWLSGSQEEAYAPKVFDEPEPKEPLPPPKGTDLAKEVLEGIKTINYHSKKGNGDVNQSRIDKALAVKPMLEILSAAGYDRANGLLDAISKIEESIKIGHGKELKFNTSDGMFDATGLSLVMGDAEKDLFDKANVQTHKAWEKKHKGWKERKDAFESREMEKARAAGAAPTKTFQAFEDKLVEANIDTDGVKVGGGDSSINLSSKDSQKASSFNFDACKKKVRQYAMMGIPLDQMFFSNDNPVFYNGHIENGGHHVSGGDGKEHFFDAVRFYQDNPAQFKKDMESYARHKGMMALVHMNIDNDAIDKETGTVFVMRGEHVEAWGKNGHGAPKFDAPKIIPPWPIDSSTSACINHTGHFGGRAVGWKLPIWRVTDNFMIGAGSEEEICINPIRIPYPAMYFPKKDTADWKLCMDKYESSDVVKEIDKKLGKKEWKSYALLKADKE